MTFRVNLKARFIIATLAVAMVPVGGFVYVLQNLIELYEDDVLIAELAREMNTFEQVFRSNPGMIAPSQPALEGYIVRPGENTILPSNLPDLPPGNHHEIKIDGEEYNLIRRDVDNTRLYLIQDMAQIEQFEARAEQIAWVCGSLALFFAIVVAFILGNIVLQPVTRLASRVADIKPGHARARLSMGKTDREISMIASTFDDVLEQFDEFALREHHFTQDASHELRTPLAVVMSGAELVLEDASLSEKSKIRLKRVQAAASQMQELLEALLFLAREDGGGLSHNTSVRDVLENTAPTFDASHPSQGAIVTLDIEGDHWVNAPRGLVLAVINNLLRNAIEHGEHNPVTVRLSDRGLVVADTGKGIPADEIAHVFAHGTRGFDSRGQGIGLSIVKRICDRLSWRIEVYSPRGAGARFEVTF